MKKLLPLFALPLLAACGSEPEAPAEAPAAPVAEATPTLSPPNMDTFSAAFAEACPEQEAVSTAVCRAQGMGASDFTCEYGLGDDEYRRYSATVTQQDEAWVVADPETVCAQG